MKNLLAFEGAGAVYIELHILSAKLSDVTKIWKPRRCMETESCWETVAIDICIQNWQRSQVFGESVLNDAVAIVLFQTLQKSAGSPLSWATLPFLGANFAFIGFGSMAIGALRR